VLGRLLAVVLFLVTVPEHARAQEATGQLQGRVLTAEGTALAMVRVTARGPDLQQPRQVATDDRGYFRIWNLPVGTYRLQLARVGYRPVVFEGVVVRLGQTSYVGDIRIEPQPAELGEIVVRADRMLIDPTTSASSTNLTAEQIAELPTDRDFRSILTVAPQSDKSFFPGDEANVAGGTGPENAYFLDGVNITEPQFGATSADLPYNFVRELQIKTGGYEAEFGRATGGIFDVITHSGGDRVGGQVFGFFTGDGLTAEPRFPAARARETAFSEYDVGGSVGGPIRRNRLWYFLAYDPSFRRQRVELRGPVLPDDRATQHLFAAKLTWQLDPRTDVVLVAHGDPARLRTADLAIALDSIANPEAVASTERQGGVVLSLSSRRRLGTRTLMELGAARFTHEMESAAPSEFGRTEPSFRDLAAGVIAGGLGIRSREDGVRTSARLALTAGLGAHAPKVGLEYEDNRLDLNRDFSARPGSPGGYIFRLGDTTFIWVRGLIAGSLHNRVLTGFLQDSWQVSDRLMINVGVRWDGQFLSGADRRVAQRFTNQWQPRAGFALALSAPGADKLFASYARFYEQIPLNLSALYYSATGNVALGYDHDPRTDPTGADTLIDATAELEPARDLRGQSFDEVTVGYERVVGAGLRAELRVVTRALRWALEDAINPATGKYELGNPGRGNLAFAPRARREYRALALTLEGEPGRRIGFRASYVLSRLHGNYEGPYDYFGNAANPNATAQFDVPDQYRNSTGRLPNDRPSVLKLSGSWRPGCGLTIGTAVAWMQGTPRNEFGGTPYGPPLAFLRPRGSAGRTENVLDLNLRLSYTLRPWSSGAIRPRMYLDLFHLGNQRSAVAYDDVHYFAVDDAGRQTNPNPTYGRPVVFQPPMSARVGVSLDFGAEP
jgi:hypothetical protein